MKFTVLTIFKWPYCHLMFGDIKYIHIVLQPSPPSVSRTLVIFPNWNSTPIQQ